MVFKEELNRFLLLTKASSHYSHRRTSLKTTFIMVHVLDIFSELLENEINVTLRDVFYRDVELFGEQGRF